MPEPTNAPAPNTDPAPPNITLDDIMGPGAAAASTPANPAAPAATPAKPSSLQELSKAFGVAVPEDAAPEVATAALRPVIDMIARGGMQQQQQQATAPQNQWQQPANANTQQQWNQQQITPPASPAAAKPVEFNVDDLDLGEDASPQVVKAFKTLADRSQKALSAVQHEALVAQNQAAQVQQHFAQEHQNAQAQQEQAVTQRAVDYMDKLASPKYGVGANRTLVQTMASEQVMRTAGHIIRGLQNYGQSMPIEQVMKAAILATDGELPAPAGTTNTPASQSPGMAPGTPAAPAGAPARRVGSAGVGQALMSDTTFLDGARAILAR